MGPHVKKVLAPTVDEYAETLPTQRYALHARGPEVSDGFQEITFKDLARAVNYMSWWIESAIGPAQSFETLAYMGSDDIRYFVFMLACQKTGYQVKEDRYQMVKISWLTCLSIALLSFCQELGRRPCSSAGRNALQQVLFHRRASDTRVEYSGTCSWFGPLFAPGYQDHFRA